MLIRNNTRWSARAVALALFSLLGAGCTELVWVSEARDGATDVLQTDTATPDADVAIVADAADVTPFPDASDGGPVDADVTPPPDAPSDVLQTDTATPDADVAIVADAADVTPPPDASDGGPVDADVTPPPDAPSDVLQTDTATPDADVAIVADAADVTPPPDVRDVPDTDVTDVGPDAPVCPGLALCVGRCVNTATDGANCGRCGNACAGGQVCSAGACACPSGQTLCTGRCVNTATDSANCGRCGGACPAGITCSASACVDAVSIAPDLGGVSRRFYIESPALTGGDRTWDGYRRALESEYLDTLAFSVEGYYAPILSGRGYKIGRSAFRFSPVGLPAGVRITAARIDFRHSGRWGDPARTILVVVPFTPASDALVRADYALARWGMASSMGEASNALWADGGIHSILFTSGLERLAVRVPFWLGLVTGHDRDNVPPPDGGGTVSGLAVDPASVRLRISYAP